MHKKSWEDDEELIWPCQTCGADQAPTCVYDENLNVIGCANCEHLPRGTHLNSSECWCHPILVHIGPDGESEPIYQHNMKQ